MRKGNSMPLMMVPLHINLAVDATGDHITMGGPQLALLDRAYSALKESVYDAIVVQMMNAANDAAYEVRRVGC